MFRENYLPKGNIYKCSSSGKYFFKKEGRHKLVEDNGKFILGVDSKLINPYYADTLDEILAALYELAYDRHLRQIHTDITNSGSIMI